MTIGPLGFASSETVRYLPPSGASLRLWHERTGSSVLSRRVSLIPPDVGIVRAYQAIHLAAQALGMQFSPWAIVLSRASFCEAEHAIPSVSSLLCECLLGDERKAVVISLLKSEIGPGVRDLLNERKGSMAGHGASEEVVNRLTDEEQLQLLLLASDRRLVSSIDACCGRREIKIPPSEIRSPKTHAPYPFLGAVAEPEIGSLGIRHPRGEPLVSLTQIIFEAYTVTDKLDDLAWKVRCPANTSVQVALATYIREHGPLESVRGLALSSRKVCREICTKLGVNQTEHNTDVLVDVICWKLGFVLAKLPDPLQTIREHIAELRTCVLAIDSLDDQGTRDNIRRAGVNVFVDLEAVLQKVVAFVTWLLATDHAVDSRLVYRNSSAMRAVPRHIGESLSSSDGATYTWSVEGRNVFATIFTYLGRLKGWVDELPERDRAPLLRNIGPVSVERSSTPFAFRHMHLWADCTPTSLQTISADLSTLLRIIGNADIAGVRNGLDHYREPHDFPSLERLIALPTRLEQAIEIIERARFFPKHYRIQTFQRYLHGHYDVTLADYRGGIYTISGPAHLRGLRRQEFLLSNSSVILAPPGLLGYPYCDIVFVIGFDTPFSRYWDGYPRARSVGIGDYTEVVPPSGESVE